jgi:hypothetical protein
MWAVRLSGVLGGNALPAQGVLARRHDVQVVWIATSPDATEMIELHPVRNRPNEMLVEPPVG